MELIRSSISIDCGLPCVTVRSAPAIVFSGPAQRSLTLWPARSPSRQATLYIESSDSFVASAAAATEWSEPVPGRELHPLKSRAFSRRTVCGVGDAKSQTLKDRMTNDLLRHPSSRRRATDSGLVVHKRCEIRIRLGVLDFGRCGCRLPAVLAWQRSMDPQG
jgi:hypothetical protein